MKRKNVIILVGIIALMICLSIAVLLSNLGSFSTANNINDNHDGTGSLPTATPTPLPSPTVSPSPQPTTSPTTNPTPTSSPTPTATPTPTPAPTSTPIPTPSSMPIPNPESTIFKDDFQSGNTNAWTNTENNSVAVSVENSVFKCSTNFPTSDNWGYVYKWLDQNYTSLDWRWYVYFGNLPTTDGNIIGVGGIYTSIEQTNFVPNKGACSLSVVHQNGDCYWRLDFQNDTSRYYLNSTSTVSANTWYLVELNAVQGVGNGEVHLFLNDVETLNATGLTNNINGAIDQVTVGGGITADQPISWYCASAVASTEHVGPLQTITTDSLSLTSQVPMTGPIIMSIPLICAAFLAINMLLKAKIQQNLTKTDINKTNKVSTHL